LLLIGLPALAAAVAIVWLIVDDASESRREREATEQRAADRRLAANRKRLIAEQKLHLAHVEPAPRPELVGALEAAVLEDARRRVRRGNLNGPIRRVDCEPYPRTAPRRAQELDPKLRSGRYFCLAVRRNIVGTGEGSLGSPFFARIRYREARLAWCRINPIPGEQAVPDPRTVALLPAACT
jgi:hypothetical protein